MTYSWQLITSLLLGWFLNKNQLINSVFSASTAKLVFQTKRIRQIFGSDFFSVQVFRFSPLLIILITIINSWPWNSQKIKLIDDTYNFCKWTANKLKSLSSNLVDDDLHPFQIKFVNDNKYKVDITILSSVRMRSYLYFKTYK